MIPNVARAVLRGETLRRAGGRRKLKPAARSLQWTIQSVWACRPITQNTVTAVNTATSSVEMCWMTR